MSVRLGLLHSFYDILGKGERLATIIGGGGETPAVLLRSHELSPGIALAKRICEPFLGLGCDALEAY